MTIEVYKELDQPKAEWLFEGTNPIGQPISCQNSEPWWTSLFSLVLLHLARNGLVRKIPLKRLIRFNKSETIFETVEPLDYADITFSNVAIEARIKEIAKTLLKIPAPLSPISGMVPDITIVQPKKENSKGNVILIENKTVRAGIDRLLEYPSIRDWLKHDWNVQLIVLMSLGYSNKQFWQEIPRIKESFLFILWEDVLRLLVEMDELDAFRSLFDIKLKPYYERVKPEAS